MPRKNSKSQIPQTGKGLARHAALSAGGDQSKAWSMPSKSHGNAKREASRRAARGPVRDW